MRRFQLSIGFILLWFSANCQQLTLQECQEAARVNYPLFKQQALIDQTTKMTIETLMAQYFPQFVLGGQATYQSDVTKVDLNLPAGFPKIDIPTPDKDQYKVFLDASQTVFGGGSLGVQQQITRAEAKTSKQQIEVALYALKDRINHVYFGILLADEQLRLAQMLKNDLDTALEKVKTMVTTGVVLETNQLRLEAELVKLNQNIRHIEQGRNALLEVLSLLTGKKLSGQTTLQKPTRSALFAPSVRPELTLIDYQKETLKLQNRQLTARNVPEISLFLQGGWGKPALNLFSNEFKPYYIGGVRLHWYISQLYTIVREKRNIDSRLKIYDTEKEMFALNNKIEQAQQNSKISQLKTALTADDQLIELSARIKQTAQIQLENGIITSADFIQEANAENQARQTKALHEIELLAAEYALEHIGTNDL